MTSLERFEGKFSLSYSYLKGFYPNVRTKTKRHDCWEQLICGNRVLQRAVVGRSGRAESQDVAPEGDVQWTEFRCAVNRLNERSLKPRNALIGVP